jgi:tripartite-type tricarboxylate transporter receptor subunit TctC
LHRQYRAISKHYAPNLPIALPRDFVPIGFLTHQPMFIAVTPQRGVNSRPELIALAKSKPGELSYATTGRGRITHLTTELLQTRAGIRLQMIRYGGGPTAAMGARSRDIEAPCGGFARLRRSVMPEHSPYSGPASFEPLSPLL